MKRRPCAASAVLALLLLLPVFSGGARAEDLPDLSVSPEDIGFFVDGEEVNLTVAGLPVTLRATVRNAGPGSSVAGYVIITIDGSPAANISLNTTLAPSAPLNAATVEWLWNGTAPAGNHTVRVEVNDPAGDADPSDNAAAVAFRTITEPVVRVLLDRSIVEAEVSESAQASVSIPGSVSVECEEGVGLLVQTTVSVDTGWAASIAPAEALFNSSGILPLNVCVVVPQATPASTIATITIQARGKGDGFITGVARQSARITVKPYFRVSMEVDSPHRETAPGGEAVFYVKIWNMGNSADSFNLGVENLRGLVSDGWLVMLSSWGAYSVAPGEYRMVKVTVRAPDPVLMYTDETAVIRLNATSQGAAARNETVRASSTVYVHETGYNTMPVVSIVIFTVLLVSLLVAIYLIMRARGRRTAGE